MTKAIGKSLLENAIHNIPDVTREFAGAFNLHQGCVSVVGPDTPHAVVDGQEFWFCRPGCRDTYLRPAA